MKTGRNEPCPCGSGKKYKHCCLKKDQAARTGSAFSGAGGIPGFPPGMLPPGFSSEAELNQALGDYSRYCESLPDDAHIPSLMEWLGRPNPATEVQAELRQALGGRSFASSEEAEAFIREFSGQQKDLPIADFLGLSSEQMHTILHSPLTEMSDIVTLNEQLTDEQALASPLIAGIRALLDYIASCSGQIKLTGSGSLPRKAVAACIPHCNPSWRPGDPVPQEWNSTEIQLVRDIALDLHLLDMQGDLVWLSPDGIQTRQQQPWATVYRNALEHLIDEYDWLNFLDESHRTDHFLHIADSAVFGLWLLHCYPEDAIVDYQIRFRRAFPAFYQPAQQNPASRQLLDDVVEGMFFTAFAHTLGLITYADPDGVSYRTTDLFRDTFRWKKLIPVAD
ncbi:YecA family protein [Spirochaeta africana]|uniref:SEC-C motif domain protein n=1 Tax=Spirochaeta africana (strain ATCC 700263 / DSM 8902 / Z-7692) TaxID=889378 RepID=H9ULB7_SPIAZ|nr:SEC-C metal-binding domain-containing protein [Spirochaeta africana]AFG38310.1 SEC-C motif domain protein [Spirochaeta africana DSM 8902]